MGLSTSCSSSLARFCRLCAGGDVSEAISVSSDVADGDSLVLLVVCGTPTGVDTCASLDKSIRGTEGVLQKI